MIAVLSLLIPLGQAFTAKDCLIEHIVLKQHESVEIQSPSFPRNFDGSLSCTYKIQAPEGYRPGIEFREWEMPDCSNDKFIIIDRKVGQHYNQFCGYGTPAPLTASGRFMDIVISFNSRESHWGSAASAVRMKLRISLVRNANYKPQANIKAVGQRDQRFTQKSIPTSYRRTKTDEWDLSFSNEEITNIAIGGAFVFITILGGLLFSFHLRREEQRKNEAEELEKEGHPRPRGYRGYMSKIEITTNDEAQTSSTDLGDSTDRSSNSESNPATDTPIMKKPRAEKAKTTKESRDQRRKRANERYNNRTTMERFQLDLNRALRASGFHSDSGDDNDEDNPETESSQPTIRDNYDRNAVPENPKNAQVNNNSGRQTRYKDQDYERWTQKGKPKRSETMREKLRRAFSLKSVRETLQREKSRLYGPHARPPMRQRKQNDPQDREDAEAQPKIP